MNQKWDCDRCEKKCETLENVKILKDLKQALILVIFFCKNYFILDGTFALTNPESQKQVGLPIK